MFSCSFTTGSCSMIITCKRREVRFTLLQVFLKTAVEDPSALCTGNIPMGYNFESC